MDLQISEEVSFMNIQVKVPDEKLIVEVKSPIKEEPKLEVKEEDSKLKDENQVKPRETPLKRAGGIKLKKIKKSIIN